MRIARSLAQAVDVSLHPAWQEENLSSSIAGWLWYAGIMLVGASAGTLGALMYSLAG